jgi:hypothetical protein
MTNELKGDFYCVWGDRTCLTQLHLRDKTLKEAMEIAEYMGFTPWTWYNPSTWCHSYTFQAHD